MKKTKRIYTELEFPEEISVSFVILKIGENAG